MQLLQGDCLEILKTLPENSLDCCVCDPPYGLSFMGKRWDYQVPSVDVWREVLRVLKPGGHALIACGTRTQHRMAVNIEDAGFEIRDVVTWLYGSGFPKSLDVSKAIDKAAGAEREVIGLKDTKGRVRAEGWGMTDSATESVTAPATVAAKQWQGFGTALKPACEFWTLARKPLSEKTVAANVLRWGTGALNIDGTRIEHTTVNGGNLADNSHLRTHINGGNGGNIISHEPSRRVVTPNAQGRWPANLLLDEEAAQALDAQSIAGGIHSAGKARPRQEHVGDFGVGEHGVRTRMADHRFDDKSIGASRFFYVAKASKAERNRGLKGMPERNSYVREGANNPSPNRRERADSFCQNHHPTVKPIKLMEYLITLVCPPGGVVLDPFLGSGSTLVAAKRLGLSGVGVEREPEYLEIARRRVEAEL